MTYEQLFLQIKRKSSFLCVGLDTDLAKLPTFILNNTDPIFEFNKQIVDSTAPYAIAYKPNLAFYEAYGSKGWQSLEKTVQYIRKNYPEIFLIADAKRGDIGNTANMYAKAFFETLDFDAITLSPYMGADTVKPFLKYKGKWVIILALTSNESALDFQTMNDSTGQNLYQRVLQLGRQWGTHENVMFVTGATQAPLLKDIRHIIPHHFLLVPGVGAQGGSLEEVAENTLTPHCGIIVNSSREIIYASNGLDFAQAAAEKAKELQMKMKAILLHRNLI
ncbi:MAG: orotidine-5'-phosphate decarboxylase [Bacteroidales bacterium]|nr:orotidine-5'-phosphate decarboxylase [Bacteroidales bacterium]